MRKDFREVAEDELKDLVRMIAQMDYSERTKVDYNATIKKFFKRLNPNIELS